MIDWERERRETYFEKGEGPFYTDYLYSVQEHFPNAGLAGCDWSNGDGIPRLFSHKLQLVEYFNINYALREIGAETESRFQMLVNKVFHTIKRRYEYYFTLYETNDIKELGRVIEESYALTRDSQANSNSNSAGSSDSVTTTKSKFQDMPIQQFLENGNYATNITNGDGTEASHNASQGSSSNTVHTTDELLRLKNENDTSKMEQVNQNIEMWKDLVVMFVYEFRNCFINELGRI